jgi:uncharacterized membrane protein|tara:strand:+ start:3342 stop:3572 length:231 start_codon:yes stop_codon:yes gene_type:complete
MKRKTLLIIVVLIVLLLTVSSVYAATRAKPTQEKTGVGRRFFDGIVCFLKCGWPAWILILLPPVAVWFYTRFIHVF